MSRRARASPAIHRIGASILFVAILSLSAPKTAISAQQWIKLTSPNFEMFTTAGEKRGRRIIFHFEQVRSFFQTAGNTKLGSSLPVRIIFFKSKKEFKPYQRKQFSSAYYLSVHDRDYIVMGNIASDRSPVAVHEYVHLLIRHLGLKLPLWLNEGLAELYSTLKSVGGKVLVGDIIPGRYQVLQRKKWLDLETLTAVDKNSPYYNERNRAGVFYAQSWALTHMLNLSKDYIAKFSEFYNTAKSGSTATAAFQQVYGKSMDQVQKDLEGYMRRSQLRVAPFDIQMEKAAERPEVQIASALESGLMLANLLVATRKQDEAIKMYAKLAEENPTSWKVEEALGYLERGNRSMEGAREHFARAVELGSTNAKFYLDYSRLLRVDDADESAIVPLLRKAIELKPDFGDAHYDLGFILFDQRSYPQAIVHLGQVGQVSREQAVPMFRAMAYSYYQLGRWGDAKRAAERARQYARGPSEILATEELLRFVTRKPSAEAEQPGTVSATSNPDQPAKESAPRLARKSSVSGEPASAKPPAVLEARVRGTPTYMIEGTLHQIECLGKAFRLHILSAGREISLAILDPNLVTIKGKSSYYVDFTCGPQKPTPVAVGYQMKEDRELGTVGIVRSIEFK